MDTTYITVAGRKFLVELYDKRCRAVFVDQGRSYAKVASATIDAARADSPQRLDAVLRSIARLIIRRYREQYENFPFQIEFLDGATLSKEEKAQRIGLVQDGRTAAMPLKIVPARRPKR